MSEVFGGHLNAGVFNYSGSTETLKQCVANDDTFRFMNSVKKKNLPGKNSNERFWSL